MFKVYAEKSRTLIVGNTDVSSQVEVDMNDEIMDVYSSFKRLSSSFSEDRELQGVHSKVI